MNAHQRRKENRLWFRTNKKLNELHLVKLSAEVESRFKDFIAARCEGIVLRPVIKPIMLKPAGLTFYKKESSSEA